MFVDSWKWIRDRNPFERALSRVMHSREIRSVLICWNRGLGDIPLGLYALVTRLHIRIPSTKITFITRSDLRDGFLLLENVHVLTAPSWKRYEPIDLTQTLQQLHIQREDFDWVIESPDPTAWFRWQHGTLVPKLYWKEEWNTDPKVILSHLPESRACIGIHLHSETTYSYQKNWPLERWEALFSLLLKWKKGPLLIFGLQKHPPLYYDHCQIIDLRGEISLLTVLFLLQHRCQTLIVPDSGLLSISYYLDKSFPLKVISLWADPHQGVLKQRVASPNPLLIHIPCIARQGKISQIQVEDILWALME